MIMQGMLEKIRNINLDKGTISLSNGKVTPNSGTTDDSFSFQVTYTSTSGIAPQNVNLYVDNNSNSMGSGSSNWSNGVVYSKSLNNFSIGGTSFILLP